MAGGFSIDQNNIEKFKEFILKSLIKIILIIQIMKRFI